MIEIASKVREYGYDPEQMGCAPHYIGMGDRRRLCDAGTTIGD